MPPSSLCGKAGERCCRWLRHQQGGTCRVGRALGPLQAYCCPALSFPSGPRDFQNPPPHPTGCFGSIVAQAPSRQDPTGGGGELCPETHGHLRQGRAALPSVRAGAGRDYRSQHAAACLSLLLLLPSSSSALPGGAQGCCRRRWSRHPWGMSRGRRGRGAGSPAAGEALGDKEPERPMLRRPDWKRTRQACGSSWRLIPLCPGKRGGPGRESLFSGLWGPRLWGSQSDT